MNGEGNKVYVDVTVEFDADGRMLPRELVWEDHRRFLIDRVTDMRPAFAQKAGGQGDRYTVQILGQEKYLFFERNPESISGSVGKWFVERA